MNGVKTADQAEEAATLNFYDRAEVISSETMADLRYIETNRSAEEWLDKLMASLTDEQQEWLSEFESAVAGTDSLMAEHAYRQGMADGVAMMARRRRAR